MVERHRLGGSRSIACRRRTHNANVNARRATKLVTNILGGQSEVAPVGARYLCSRKEGVG